MMYLAIVDDEIWEDDRGLVTTLSRRRLIEADTLQDLLAFLERWARQAYTNHTVDKISLEPGTGVREGSVDITARLIRIRNGCELHTWKRIGSLEEYE